MGNLFSFSSKNNSEGEEYLKAIETLKKQEEDLYKSAQNEAEKRKRILEESLQRQKEISAQRMAEMEYMINRAIELKDMRRLLYIQAAQLICAIYYNYQFGDIDENDANWNNNVTTVIDKCLTVDTFWILCKIPHLLPLLWMTGADCDSFHEYKLDEKGDAILSDYKSYITTNIEKYVFGSLANNLSNVCQSNCKKYIDTNQERNSIIGSKCKEYLEKVELSTSDDEWVKLTFDFIKDDDKMNWKCFAARSGKGITKNKIRLLPSTFPKICPNYELYNALLMVSNTVINHYGDLRNDSGLKVKSGNHTNGGQCFELNEKWINNSYNLGINMNDIWDGESFININELIIREKDITGYDDSETWMKNTSLHKETYLYGKNPDGTGGYLKYENPTQKYTHQFINDIDNVEVAFQMPRLSADINETFRNEFIYNIFTTLTTNKDYMFYNVYNTVNRNILTSIDYVYIIPDGFEQVDNVSPICRYIFEVLIKYSCKWFITIPIESTISMMKVNTNLLLNDNKNILPQYIWATDDINISMSSNKEYKNTTDFSFKNIEPENIEI